MNKQSTNTTNIKKLLHNTNIDMGTFGLIELELQQLDNLKHLIINKITELSNKHPQLSNIIPPINTIYSTSNTNIIKLLENTIAISTSLNTPHKSHYQDAKLIHSLNKNISEL